MTEADVKVAGASFAARPGDAAARSGDTAGMEPIGTGPAPLLVADPLGPREELTGAPARPARSGGRTGLKIAAVAAGAAVVVGGGAVAALAFAGDSAPAAADGKKDAAVSQPLADAAVVAPDPKVVQAERHKLAVERASRAARGKAKAPSLLPKGEPIPTKKPEDAKDKKDGGTGGTGGGAGADPIPAGEAQQIAKSMLPGYGFGGSGQFACLVKLWNKESGWRVNAANPSSGAYGIPQALPGSKMASAGSDWRTNARTQIKWGLGYIKGRYGTPCGAWSHSQSVGWY
ncbi:lytic transglycosylase domain-containing protein [Actinomadura hibisca]|uniref:aggregation-promoting factor C-terminal-like domain-containing protein n=1 Tax=Actinomadura hibisca TaxID=68565 RepID=UPI001FDED05A|nr:lytic transglycosylase domain-containing protein [Actinomadura hibisca]